MNNLYCTLTGRYPETMKIKILLRITLFIALILVRALFGMDIAVILISIIVVSDLDEIADTMSKKSKKECKEDK